MATATVKRATGHPKTAKRLAIESIPVGQIMRFECDHEGRARNACHFQDLLERVRIGQPTLDLMHVHKNGFHYVGRLV